MARVALSMLLALAAVAPAWARHATTAAPAAQCPSLTVSCPELVAGGQPVTFSLNVEGAAASSKLTYTWTVSAGAINSGQHTSVITVDTTGLGGQAVEATVEVAGLPASCPKSASCAVSSWACGYRRPIDSYGDINFEDEKARLDNFAIELQNDPTTLGYIVAYGGRRARAGAARRRADRAKNYLAGTRGIDPARVFIIDGGHREDLTLDIYAWPPGVPPPQASPTVDASGVEIIAEEPSPKRTARQPRRRN
jgi:hypothetical protein